MNIKLRTLWLVLVLALAGVLAMGAAAGAAAAAPSGQSGAPFYYDALGPMRDVTAVWQRYQPANSFCVQPDVPQYTPGGVGPTVTGRNPACRHSGFRRRAKGLLVVKLRTPTLCSGCHRLFIDFSRIPAGDPPVYYSPRGHMFYRLASSNFTYTVDPLDHSPNTKNFTNDKLLAPSGSAEEQIIGAGDQHQMFGYAGDTAHFVHTAIQGPYYIGPWYVNRKGRRIHGVYFDVDVAGATQFPDPQFNTINYAAGFNTGQSCPPEDQDAFYGGCVDWWGYSVSTVNPFPA